MVRGSKLHKESASNMSRRAKDQCLFGLKWELGNGTESLPPTFLPFMFHSMSNTWSNQSSVGFRVTNSSHSKDDTEKSVTKKRMHTLI